MNELPNLTATEVRANLAAGIKQHAKTMEVIVAPMIDGLLDAQLRAIFVWGLSRSVCARRARKLRKRGCSVRWAGYTSTGKIRYVKVLDVVTWT